MRSRSNSRFFLALLIATLALVVFPDGAFAANSGTVHGVVVDPDQRPIPGVSVQLRNDITGFKSDAATGDDGTFQFYNVPYNPYELHVELQGFKTAHLPIEVRSAIPVELRVPLELAGVAETVTVTSEAVAAQLETDTSVSHVDIDKSYIAKAPATVASRAMEELVTSTPGFTKDENGRFHFQGAHSQSQYVVDGQTISDQTGMTFSNSIDPGIAESVEIIYGNVPAEYGEKTGAVINLVTKSGVGESVRGDVYAGAARYSTYEGGAAVGGGFGEPRHLRLGERFVFGSLSGPGEPRQPSQQREHQAWVRSARLRLRRPAEPSPFQRTRGRHSP